MSLILNQGISIRNFDCSSQMDHRVTRGAKLHAINNLFTSSGIDSDVVLVTGNVMALDLSYRPDEHGNKSSRTGTTLSVLSRFAESGFVQSVSKTPSTRHSNKH